MVEEPTDATGIPFSFFCSLLREIAQASPRRRVASARQPQPKTPDYPALQVLNNWITALNERFSPLPRGTTATIFQFLFPEEDTRRKYDMQESRLAQSLADCFGIEDHLLSHWDSQNSSGCLGDEVRIILERSCSSTENISSLNIDQVSKLLDELASLSGYSHSTIRSKHIARRPRLIILRALYGTLSPIDASFLTQIILKDLRPLLYPLDMMHYTAALKDFNSASVKMLTKEHAMNAWDTTGWMLKTYRIRSTLEAAAAGFEEPENQRKYITPLIGTPIEIPKSEKGRDSSHALESFHKHGSKKLWAETKYDGERAQIHVEVFPDGKSHITIFSKSKRDSTHDRHAVHHIIRKTLGLSLGDSNVSKTSCKVKKNIILDAEMVACDGTRIDEFWRIHGLVASTAYGIRGMQKGKRVDRDTSSQCSMVTDISENRHLGLVFFDVLVHDSTSLLMIPYSERRAVLETLIKPIPGEAMLSERFPIDLVNKNVANNMLQAIFSRHIADREEGLVLKAEEAFYNDYRRPWVKLKKDYIEGYGDTLDLVVVGAGWDKVRGRELSVPPTALTTFYIGVLSNLETMKSDNSIKPHFEIYFTVSYGMSRHQLEETIFLMKSSEFLPYSAPLSNDNLSYTFSLFTGIRPPTILIQEPLLAELFGAGFTKSPQCKHYELRFPRITKIYRRSERSWKDGVSLQELHKIACDVVGRDRSSKDVDDWCNELWGKPVSPSVRSHLKRKATAEAWEEKLASLHLKRRRGATKDDHASSRGSSSKKTVVVHVKRTKMPRPVARTKPLGARTNIGEDSPIPFVIDLTLQADDKDLPETAMTLPVQGPLSAGTYGTTSNSKLISHTPSFPEIVTNTSLPKVSEPECKPAESESISSSFLKESLVWLARPRSGVRRTARPPWRSLISPECRLHSLESLFAGCGWDHHGHSVRVKRGIVLVDDDDDVGKEWKTYAVTTLQHKSTPAGQSRKPIYVINCKALMDGGRDIESKALYRFG